MTFCLFTKSFETELITKIWTPFEKLKFRSPFRQFYFMAKFKTRLKLCTFGQIF